MKNCLLIVLLVAFSVQAEPRQDVSYRGHNVSLMNKHGWIFSTQPALDKYLSRYYTWVSEYLNKKRSGEIGYVVKDSTVVNGYRYNIDIDSPSDHILSVYQHERPVIARKWVDRSGGN